MGRKISTTDPAVADGLAPRYWDAGYGSSLEAHKCR